MKAKMQRLVCAWSCMILLCFLATTSQGQEKQDGSDEYLTLVSEALAEFDRGHFAESRALFFRAHALKPSARTLRGLGIASFELREYRATIHYMEQALASREKPLDAELRGKTQAILDRAHAFVGHYTLQVDPPDARLKVDGVSVSTSAPLLLDIGSHVMSADAPGHIAETRTLHVLGGEVLVLPITLTPRPSAVSTPLPAVSLPPAASAESASVPLTAPAPLVDEGDGRKRKRKIWWWTLGGVALTGAAAAAIGVTLARNGDDGGGPSPVTTGQTIAVLEPLEVR